MSSGFSKRNVESTRTIPSSPDVMSPTLTSVGFDCSASDCTTSRFSGRFCHQTTNPTTAPMTSTPIQTETVMRVFFLPMVVTVDDGDGNIGLVQVKLSFFCDPWNEDRWCLPFPPFWSILCFRDSPSSLLPVHGILRIANQSGQTSEEGEAARAVSIGSNCCS